jgi:hypothetical protein
MIEKSFVLIAPDEAGEECKAKSIEIYHEETQTPAVRRSLPREQEQPMESGAKWVDYPPDHGFEKILEEWKKEYDDLYSEKSTQQI